MTLDEFVQELREDVDRFQRHWRRAQTDITQAHYPEEMEPGEWGEQWLAFLEMKFEDEDSA